jgi:hypothetical protein
VRKRVGYYALSPPFSSRGFPASAALVPAGEGQGEESLLIGPPLAPRTFQNILGWVGNWVVEHLPSIGKALGSIPTKRIYLEQCFRQLSASCCF